MTRRWSRRLLIGLGVSVVVLGGAAIALPHLVDVNRYRPLIVRQMEQATGRRVRLGALSFRLLPVPGIGVEKISVASARHPDKVVDLTVDSLSIRAALLPLLQGRLVVKSIRLERPALALHRDADGRWNFEDVVTRATRAPGAGPEPAAKDTLAVMVHRAEIKNGRILLYDDWVRRGTRLKLELAPIDATVEGWGATEETRLRLAAGIGGSRIRTGARLSGGSGADPRLELKIHSAGLEAKDIAALLPWTGVLQPAGMDVGGRVDIEGQAMLPLKSPEKIGFRGALTLHGLRYRDAGMARPIEGVGGTLTVDGDHATWKDFTLRAGGSSLSGNLEVEDFLRPRIRFDLNSPHVDFNELILLATPPAGGVRTPGQAAGGGAAGGSTPSAEGGLIRQVRGGGRLRLESVRFQTFDLTDVQASVTVANGVFGLQDLTGAIYGGRIRGAAEVALERPVPRQTLRVRLESVDVDPLLTAYGPDLKGLLRGRLSGGLTLRSSGADMEPILGSLQGEGDIEIRQGVVTSFSVLKQLASLLEVAGGKGIGRDETAFEYLRATLQIADRRARTDDLTLHAEDLDLEGKGWVGLDATLDLDAATRFSEEATRGMVEKHRRLETLTEEGRLAVYFNLHGALAAPSFRLDTRAQVRQATRGAKDRVEKRILDRIRERILDQPAEQTEETTPSEPTEPGASPP